MRFARMPAGNYTGYHAGSGREYAILPTFGPHRAAMFALSETVEYPPYTLYQAGRALGDYPTLHDAVAAVEAREALEKANG